MSMIKHSTFPALGPTGEPLVRLLSDLPGQGDALEKTAGIHPEILAYKSQLEPEPGKTYVHILALGAGDFYGPNLNNDHFPWAGLSHDHTKTPHPHMHGYKTFLNAHAFAHHMNKDPEKAYGDVLLSVLNNKMKRVELIVAIDEEKCIRNGGAKTLERIKAGEYPSTSMGCRVPFDVCSICSHKAKFRSEYCEHMQNEAGKIYADGRRVFVYNPYPRFFDISFVFIGADRTSFVLEKVANSQTPPPSMPPHMDGSQATGNAYSEWHTERPYATWDRPNWFQRFFGTGTPVPKPPTFDEQQTQQWAQEDAAYAADIVNASLPSHNYPHGVAANLLAHKELHDAYVKRMRNPGVDQLGSALIPTIAGLSGAVLGAHDGRRAQHASASYVTAPFLNAALKPFLPLPMRLALAVGGPAFTNRNDAAPPLWSYSGAQPPQQQEEKRGSAEAAMRRKLRKATGTVQPYVGIRLHHKVEPEWKNVPTAGKVRMANRAAIKQVNDLAHRAESAAYINVGNARALVGTQQQMPTADQLAPAEALAKEAARKEAEVQKISDIFKSVNSLPMGRAVPMLTSSDHDIPTPMLDRLSQETDLGQALGGLGAAGIVLKPQEFQRVVLMRTGQNDLADKLHSAGQTFSPEGAPVMRSMRIVIRAPQAGAIPQGLMGLIGMLLGGRSALSPFGLRREAPESPAPQITVVKMPVLDKVAALYNGYREDLLLNAEQLFKVASETPQLARAIVQVRGGEYGEGGEGVPMCALAELPMAYFSHAYWNRCCCDRELDDKQFARKFVDGNPEIAKYLARVVAERYTNS